jgi:hypothetical protein
MMLVPVRVMACMSHALRLASLDDHDSLGRHLVCPPSATLCIGSVMMNQALGRSGWLSAEKSFAKSAARKKLTRHAVYAAKAVEFSSLDARCSRAAAIARP